MTATTFDSVTIYAIELTIYAPGYTDTDFLGAYRSREKADAEITRLIKYREDHNLPLNDRNYNIVDIELRD